jgi:hypothetical protein
MFATISRVRIRPNTIVQYKGGGYDGCIWEWNYAYLDGLGRFHSIVATGYRGCRTFGELRDFLDTTDYDLYELSDKSEIERFGRETPISHLLTVGKWLAEQGFEDAKLTAVCDVCGQTVLVVNCEVEGLHGIGGIAMEHDKLVCAECESNGTCHYCGEYVGSEQIDGETGYCTGAAHSEQWCHERHSDASDRSA